MVNVVRNFKPPPERIFTPPLTNISKKQWTTWSKRLELAGLITLRHDRRGHKGTRVYIGINPEDLLRKLKSAKGDALTMPWAGEDELVEKATVARNAQPKRAKFKNKSHDIPSGNFTIPTPAALGQFAAEMWLCQTTKAWADKIADVCLIARGRQNPFWASPKPDARKVREDGNWAVEKVLKHLLWIVGVHENGKLRHLNRAGEHKESGAIYFREMPSQTCTQAGVSPKQRRTAIKALERLRLVDFCCQHGPARRETWFTIDPRRFLEILEAVTSLKKDASFQLGTSALEGASNTILNVNGNLPDARGQFSNELWQEILDNNLRKRTGGNSQPLVEEVPQILDKDSQEESGQKDQEPEDCGSAKEFQGTAFAKYFGDEPDGDQEKENDPTSRITKFTAPELTEEEVGLFDPETQAIFKIITRDWEQPITRHIAKEVQTLRHLPRKVLLTADRLEEISDSVFRQWFSNEWLNECGRTNIRALLKLLQPSRWIGAVRLVLGWIEYPDACDSQYDLDAKTQASPGAFYYGFLNEYSQLWLNPREFAAEYFDLSLEMHESIDDQERRRPGMWLWKFLFGLRIGLPSWAVAPFAKRAKAYLMEAPRIYWLTRPIVDWDSLLGLNEIEISDLQWRAEKALRRARWQASHGGAKPEWLTTEHPAEHLQPFVPPERSDTEPLYRQFAREQAERQAKQKAEREREEAKRREKLETEAKAEAELQRLFAQLRPLFIQRGWVKPRANTAHLATSPG